MTGKILAALLAIGLTAVSTQTILAQAGGLNERSLTLDDAIEYALQHYPEVQASLEQISAARAGLPLARSAYLPSLNAVYQESRATQNQVSGIWLPTPITPTVEGPVGFSSGQSYWGSQALMQFSWEPFDFGLRSANVGKARSALDKSIADLAATRLQVATAVGDYFLRNFFVPVSSVANDLEQTFVVRIQNDKTDWVNVKTGVTSGTLIEVFGDLKPGDQVAVRGTDHLRLGTQVNAWQRPGG